MKRRNSKNNKLWKSGNPIIKPLIIKKKSIANEQEIRNKIKKKLINKKITGGNNNMVRKEKITKKGSSGLERVSNTKKDFDYLMGGINEAQQKVSNESTIGVNQPIHNTELLKMADLIGINQGNNQGNNKDSGLIELQKMKLMKELFSPQPQQKPESMNNALVNTFGEMYKSLTQQNQQYLVMAINEMKSGQGQPQIDPEDRLMKHYEFFRNVTGDQRQKSDIEMKYGLEREKLVLAEQSRQDMLNREERAIEREDKKSERILGMGGVVLEKILGNGVGALINDVMVAKGGKGKRRGRAKQTPNAVYAPSLLDEEL